MKWKNSEKRRSKRAAVLPKMAEEYFEAGREGSGREGTARGICTVFGSQPSDSATPWSCSGRCTVPAWTGV